MKERLPFIQDDEDGEEEGKKRKVGRGEAIEETSKSKCEDTKGRLSWKGRRCLYDSPIKKAGVVFLGFSPLVSPFSVKNVLLLFA